MIPDSIYEPREDSALILTWAKKIAAGNILEIGCGSGIISQALNSSYTGVDINPEAIAYCKKQHKGTFFISNLFSNVQNKYDTIIFNPPYLPNDPKYPDPALDGGKKGYEIILTFLAQATEYLNANGSIILLYSSLSNPKVIEEFLDKNLWEWTTLEKKQLFMESLFVIQIKKTALRVEIEKKISELAYVTKGKRSLVYKGKIKQKTVAVKVHQDKNLKLSPLEHEASILTQVNKKGIGPKIIYSTQKYIIMKWIEGLFFPQALIKSAPKTCVYLLENVLKQTRALDQLGIQKEEMHRPLKNVIVSGNNIYLLDFERARKMPKPHNVTQYCQFVTSSYLSQIITPKGIQFDVDKIRTAAKLYNQKPLTQHYEAIRKLITKPNRL